MKARVLVAFAGIPLLVVLLGWAPDWATMLLSAGMCGIGALELCRAVLKEKALTALAVLAAALTPVCVYGEERGVLPALPFTAVLAALFVFSLFLYAILHYGKRGAAPFADVTAALFAGLAFPLMLSCLLRLRMEGGRVLVFLPLCISFGSDTLALFAGMLFGKHKLAPLVSPKKTVEGAIGGLAGGVLGTLLLSWIGSHILRVPMMEPIQILGFGVVGSAISQVGDLSFSVIKREFGVKDYGRLLPGHGGILDRFDSVTFAAPAVYLTLLVFSAL